MTPPPQTLLPLLRQLAVFGSVGLVAMAVHYGILLTLVELLRAPPVPATLAGYAVGGLVSYVLNRRLTFASDAPHEEAGMRFALVAGVGFCVTWMLMQLFTVRLGAPYFPAQIATTLVVMAWSYVAHRFWTFGSAGRKP